MRLDFYFKLAPSIATESIEKHTFHCQKSGCYSEEGWIAPSKFCPECGTKISKTTEIIGTRHIDPYDFCEEYFNADERVARDNGGMSSDIWLWNKFLSEEMERKYSFKAEDFRDVDNGLNLDLSTIDYEQAIKDFKSDPMVKEFLDKFEEVYGEGSIEVKYGLFSPVY